jgi:hypothetical protein
VPPARYLNGGPGVPVAHGPGAPLLGVHVPVGVAVAVPVGVFVGVGVPAPEQVIVSILTPVAETDLKGALLNYSNFESTMDAAGWVTVEVM